MASKKENVRKPNYCIKLLAGNNVVLVEANNYESEIFVPEIVNGRITFQNIIPNRRCCQDGGRKLNLSSKLQNVTKRPLLASIAEGENNRQVYRLSAGQRTEFPVPLANSTPVGVNRITRKTASASVLTTDLSAAPNPYNSVNNSSLPTPEPVRKAVPPNRRILNINSIDIPKGMRVVQLYHDNINTPKKVGRLVPTSARGSQDLSNLSILNGSYRQPTAPSIPNSVRKSTAASSPNCLQTTLGSVTKWRKVLIPRRTYTRRSDKPVMVCRSTPVSSAKKSVKSRKVIPTYLVNPTQAPKVTHKIEMMKRKLIIDGKVNISPRTFRKQLQHPMSPALNLPHQRSLNSKIILHASAQHVKPLPKSRHQLESLKMSAFDLLTNSNRFRCMADNLNNQFRNGCVNKASSTYNKYRVLSTVPPLQQDEQILDISRNSIPKNFQNAQKNKRNTMITKSISTQILMH